MHDDAGRVVGSALLGQPFTDADGDPLPEYFQPRPSAAGDGYDAAASSGSNLGPENEDLVAAITERRAQVAELEGIDPAEVPVDALTASGSGLDPHISPAYAPRPGRPCRDGARPDHRAGRGARRAAHWGRALGYLGEPTVNVLELNVDLDRIGG